MAEKWRIKKGDRVVVITGKDKGVKGEVLQVVRDERKVVVSGVNVVVKHKKPTASAAGGLEKREMPIHISNVMFIDASSGSDVATRIGYKCVEGKKNRFCKRTGVVLS